jgi:adenylosuccinate lyase
MIPFDSMLLSGAMSTPKMRAVWSEKNLIRSWMRVENAITEVQASLGMIPAEAAREIIAHLTPERVPIERILQHAAASGHLMVAFLRAFREVCGPAAEHFHLGPTTQDILDTGLTLQLREASLLLMESLLRLEYALCHRAAEYKSTPMAGRTHEQLALPFTFGFVLAGWAAEIRDHIETARQSEHRWLFGSLTGGVGTQNAFVELSNVPTARLLEEKVCAKLGLPLPLIDLHTRFSRFAEVVVNLALHLSTLGRIALQLRTMERPEVSEIEQDYPPEACSSSSMPNKRNPEPLERVDGLAQLAGGHASAMLGVRMSDHRDSTRIPVLYTALPQSCAMAHRALETVAGAVETLRARPERMLANLNHPESYGQVCSERLMIALYRKTGRKHEAHTLLSRCAHESRTSRRLLYDVVLEEKAIREQFSASELVALLNPSAYLGTAETQVDRVLERLLPLNQAERSGLSLLIEPARR